MTRSSSTLMIAIADSRPSAANARIVSMPSRSGMRRSQRTRSNHAPGCVTAASASPPSAASVDVGDARVLEHGADPVSHMALIVDDQNLERAAIRSPSDLSRSDGCVGHADISSLWQAVTGNELTIRVHVSVAIARVAAMTRHDPSDVGAVDRHVLRSALAPCIARAARSSARFASWATTASPSAYANVTLAGERPRITNENGEIEHRHVRARLADGRCAPPGLRAVVRHHRDGRHRHDRDRDAASHLAPAVHGEDHGQLRTACRVFLRGFYERMLARQRGIGSGDLSHAGRDRKAQHQPGDGAAAGAQRRARCSTRRLARSSR